MHGQATRVLPTQSTCHDCQLRTPLHDCSLAKRLHSRAGERSWSWSWSWAESIMCVPRSSRAGHNTHARCSSPRQHLVLTNPSAGQLPHFVRGGSVARWRIQATRRCSCAHRDWGALAPLSRVHWHRVTPSAFFTHSRKPRSPPRLNQRVPGPCAGTDSR